MAFWGIEVKPGKPYTHKYDESKGRLHLSMATLALGTATAKSVLQCNVGNRSPVYLCALYPVNSESLQLNLEFEEADDVVFSVIGPRSVFLTGYYLQSGGHELEPCGEDIADTETERSEDSDEDEYEDSFIDDDDPEVYPPSPISDGGEEMLDNEKPKNEKDSRRRLRKMYQISESDDEGCSQQKGLVNGSSSPLVLQTEDEDSIPISSFYESKANAKKTPEEEGKTDKETGDTNYNKIDPDENEHPRKTCNIVDGQLKIPTETITEEVEGKNDEGTCEMSDKMGDDGGNCAIQRKRKARDVSTDGQSKTTMNERIAELNGGADKRMDKTSGKGTELELPDTVMLASSEVGCEDGERPKKKRKERRKDEKTNEAESKHKNFGKEDKALKNESNAENGVQEFALGDKAAYDKSKEAELLDNLLLLSTQAGPKDDEKPKKKRKEQLKERKIREAESKEESIVKRDKEQQIKVKADNMVLGSLNVNEFDEENHLEKDIKKKKKSKTQKNLEAVNAGIPSLPADEIGGKKVDGNSFQLRTLSNGLIIEVIEMGKPDGKVAAPGKKISINYNGKLKKNGESFDSNVGATPYKFRLGVGKVIEGWDIGLDGMRVGEKRRLTIPPSMGFGTEGLGENVPPDSWLEYDVELIKVHN